MPQKLDPFDRRILALVQQDCTVSAETIAEEIGLSASAVQRRLKRLREDKTILAEVAVVDPKRVGRPLTFIAAAEIERERPELLQELRRWLDAEPAVQQVYYVTGSADLVMIVTAESVEAYDAVTARLVAENPNVRPVTTSVTLHTFKRGLFVPAGGEA